MPQQRHHRAAIEAEVERRLAALASRHRDLIVSAMGSPPNPRRIPAKVWEQIERETKRTLYWVLLKGHLGAGLALWRRLGMPDTGDNGAPLPPEDERPGRDGLDLPAVGPDTEREAREWADKRAGEIAKGMTDAAKNKLLLVQREDRELAESKQRESVAASDVGQSVELLEARGRKKSTKSKKAAAATKARQRKAAKRKRAASKKKPAKPAASAPSSPRRRPKNRVTPTRETRRSNRGKLFTRQPTYGKVLDDVFGEQRWRTIAITETTGTISGGEVALLRRLEKNRGWKFGMKWYTSRDNRTCPVCKPLHGKTRDYFARRVGFPPAHPRCRCWLTYWIVKMPEAHKRRMAAEKESRRGRRIA